MNYDELAVVSEQLAGMLRAGMTLPDALRQTASALPAHDMQRRLQVVADRLASGQSLPAAVESTVLPPLFAQMLVIGAAGDDLPGALDAAAGHYRQANELRRRMVSMMVYPCLIMAGLLVMSFGLSGLFQYFAGSFGEIFDDMFDGGRLPFLTVVALKVAPWNWLFVLLLIAAIAVGVLLVLFVPPIQHFVRWKLPGVRHAALAQLASSLGLLVSRGVPIEDAIRIVGGTESTSMQQELRGWLARMQAGQTRFSDWTATSRILPPMFVALVDGYGDDIGGGLRTAAALYHGIARQRANMLLHAGMPLFMVMFIAVAMIQIILFAVALYLPFVVLMNRLGA